MTWTVGRRIALALAPRRIAAPQRDDYAARPRGIRLFGFEHQTRLDRHAKSRMNNGAYLSDLRAFVRHDTRGLLSSANDRLVDFGQANNKREQSCAARRERCSIGA